MKEITRKETFYHGILPGLLQNEDSWLTKSNAESGEGYSDILIETPERTGIVIEVKYASDGNFDAWCQKALNQIHDKHYEAQLLEDGMKTVISYGIACCRKQCKVVVG